jgi:hypothetical protein
MKRQIVLSEEEYETLSSAQNQPSKFLVQENEELRELNRHLTNELDKYKTVKLKMEQQDNNLKSEGVPKSTTVPVDEEIIGNYDVLVKKGYPKRVIYLKISELFDHLTSTEVGRRIRNILKNRK